MSENGSSSHKSQTFGHACENISTEPEAKPPVQPYPTAFVASNFLGVPGTPIEASTLSPVLGDNASKVSNYPEASHVRTNTHRV